MITDTFNYARRKIEGPRRNVPFSQEKLKIWSAKVYWKMRLNQSKGKTVDIHILENRKRYGQIGNESITEESQIENKLRQAIVAWDQFLAKRKESYRQYLLDFQKEEPKEVESDPIKRKKEEDKIIKNIKKEKYRMYGFHYLTHFAGRGPNKSFKKLHVNNNDNENHITYFSRPQIESTITEYNRSLYKRAHQSPIYKHDIYKRLT